MIRTENGALAIRRSRFGPAFGERNTSFIEIFNIIINIDVSLGIFAVGLEPMH